MGLGVKLFVVVIVSVCVCERESTLLIRCEIVCEIIRRSHFECVSKREYLTSKE